MSNHHYKMVKAPWHPRADKRGMVQEHILVFEKKTGISVPRGCCIHHLNGNKDDNRIENLCLMTHSAHTTFHNTGRKYSDESKKKISDAAKRRLANKENHPFYKHVDMEALIRMRDEGHTVKDCCIYAGISKRTYYDKLEEYNNAQ